MTHCPCGRPLHYTTPETQQLVQDLVDRMGENITITHTTGVVYRVSRHYIALHGIKGDQLPALADGGFIERVHPAGEFT